ncbi:MrcB family domain-containing protein [Spirochaeta dissipatitropha]
MFFSEKISSILQSYPKGGAVDYSDPTVKLIENDIINQLQKNDVIQQLNLKVEGSVGKGTWAAVPWVAIMNPEITTTVSQGVYVVLLFSAQGKSMSLTLNQGTGGINKSHSGESQEGTRSGFLEIYHSWKDQRFQAGPMPKRTLDSDTQRPRAYEKACILWKMYSLEQIRSESFDKEFIEDLTSIIQVYMHGVSVLQKNYSYTDINENERSMSMDEQAAVMLPKPFLLLAGISGTGKTRFVREQAKLSAEHFGLTPEGNYCLVPVRPDWHEPSDLLGYISRINGTRYVVTGFLRFMVQALLQAVDEIHRDELVYKSPQEIPPYWLCLDEMNLAPVEQYFADYLSVLETRQWSDNKYTSDAMMRASLLQQLQLEQYKDSGNNAFDELMNELLQNVNCDEEIKIGFREYVLQHGIPLPPNLIVAGTVNMDETTHGFSRKVIDRAFTIDFQEFFPNNFDSFFQDTATPIALSFSPISQISSPSELAHITADPEGAQSIAFLTRINEVLKNTPFELAYRALNELLLSLHCFSPTTQEELCAVWDDYLMQKVLPRIEGDSQKLRYIADSKAAPEPDIDDTSGVPAALYGSGSLLHAVYHTLEQETMLGRIWGEQSERPDLLRNGNPKIPCRSRAKLLWMMKRLKASHFTDFWV